MAQQVNMLVTKPNGLSLMPRTHTTEEENWLLQAVLGRPHTVCGVCMHSHTQIINGRILSKMKNEMLSHSPCVWSGPGGKLPAKAESHTPKDQRVKMCFPKDPVVLLQQESSVSKDAHRWVSEHPQIDQHRRVPQQKTGQRKCRCSCP